MFYVKEIVLQPTEFEVGCTNGNAQDAELVLSNGIIIPVEVCRCGNGCNGTARITGIEEVEFSSSAELYSFLYGEEGDFF